MRGLAASIWLTPPPLRSAGARDAGGRQVAGGSLAAVDVADPAAVAPAEAMDRVAWLEQLALAAMALPARQRYVVDGRHRGETPAAMRAELGFGAERTRQVARQAHRVLRERLAGAAGRHEVDRPGGPPPRGPGPGGVAAGQPSRRARAPARELEVA